MSPEAQSTMTPAEIEAWMRGERIQPNEPPFHGTYHGYVFVDAIEGGTRILAGERTILHDYRVADVWLEALFHVAVEGGKRNYIAIIEAVPALGREDERNAVGLIGPEIDPGLRRNGNNLLD